MSTGVYNNVDGKLVELTKAELDAFPSVAESELKLRDLRTTRDAMLAKTDWWASADLTMTDAQKKYRQDLRDLTAGLDTVEKVNAVVWPTKP